jgi:sortase (surface protein transpeptidase)
MTVRRKTLSNIFLAAGVVVLLIGLNVALQHHSAEKNALKTAAANGTPAPSTKKPTIDDFNNYTVEPNMPRYIYIPSINVEAVVRQMGLTKNNQIDSPKNVYDTGWFKDSALPAQPGAMVVDGHVSSWKTRGVFYGIKSLKPGQKIIIEQGNGKKITYTVVKSKTYEAEKVDINELFNPVNTKLPGLNLITCAGNVIKGSNDFDKRLVVFAEMQ